MWARHHLGFVYMQSTVFLIVEAVDFFEGFQHV
jgi:hypothetical protein